LEVCLVLGPRRDQSPRPVRETDAAPVFSTTKARREKRLSRLNSKAFILTVYASPRRSPGRHARLVSGCGPRSAGWDWLPTGFLRKVSELLLTSRPPFPGFAWRNENAVVRPNATVAPMQSATLQVFYIDMTTPQAAGVSPYFGGVQMKWTGESQTRRLSSIN
jgi:hypothetical protein